MTSPPPPAEVWRLLPYDLGSTRRHFALSDALARTIPQPTIWWHATDRPTLILGTGQRSEDVDVDACRRGGIEIVRRQSGGTAVFAGPGVLGLDVALPAGHPLALPDVVETYRWLGEVWQVALRSLGIDAHLVTTSQARAAAPPSEAVPGIRIACFGTLSPYEITVAGKKLVGLAQVRRKPGVVLQSGIHRSFDAAALASLLSPGNEDALAGALGRAAIGLDEAGGKLEQAQIMAAVQDAVEQIHHIRFESGAWTPAETALADAAT